MSKTYSRRPQPSGPTRPRGFLAFCTAAALVLVGMAAWMAFGTSAAPSAQAPSGAASTTSATATPPSQAAPAAAPQVQAAPTATPTAAPRAAGAAAKATADSSQGVAGQQAFIDPKTGQLRPAEHDDVATLNAAKAGVRRQARTLQADSEPQQFATEGGAMGVAVPDDLQPYTVATKTPDGRIAIEHVTGGKVAADKVKANSAKKGGLEQRKGEPNDR